MKVKIHGAVKDNEYEIAHNIKDIFDNDKKLAATDSKIDMFSSFQAYGQQGNTDIDLVLVGLINDYSETIESKTRKEDSFSFKKVKIQNFICTIEIKESQPNQMWLENGHIMIKYRDSGAHSVTVQSRGQYLSLQGFLKDKIDRPYITNLIYFPNISSSQVKFDHKNLNVLFSDFTLSDFWYKLLLKQFPREYKIFHYSNCLPPAKFDENYPQVIGVLNGKKEITRLDRKRLEQICRKNLKTQEYVKLLGKQLLIFSGKGGTGKTQRLLNLAINLYEERCSRILILTYNNALISDVRRSFALIGVSDGLEETVQIKSIFSYWRKVFLTTGIVDEKSYDINEHDIYIDELYSQIFDASICSFCGGGIIDPGCNLCAGTGKLFGGIAKKIHNDGEIKDWDFVMVDEAQDWPEKERDILYRIFGHTKIVVADGKSQLIRSNKTCQWDKVTKKYDEKGYFDDNQRQRVPCPVSLRQKNSLTLFIKELASKLGQTWDVKTNDLYEDGGSIIIFEGKYNKEFHKKLINRNKKGENENIDMLFVVPPNNIIYMEETRASKLSKSILDWGYDVWDGVDIGTRKGTFPTKLTQFRIVQYDSCRGLEGWISVNINLEDFYQYKWKEYEREETNKPEQQSFKTEDQKRMDYVAKWLLISFTRAIDTLVINIEDTKYPIYDYIKEISDAHPDWPIEWIKPE